MRYTELLVRSWDSKSLMVRHLMESAVVTCRPDTDAGTIARTMMQQNFGSLPVVDGEMRLIGLVSEYDLLQAVIEERDLRKIAAADVMTRNVLTVKDLPLRDLATLFQDRCVTRVPVVRDGKLVGIVARRDLVFGYMKALEYWS